MPGRFSTPRYGTAPAKDDVLDVLDVLAAGRAEYEERLSMPEAGG